MDKWDWVPWDSPKEILVWIVVLAIATFFIHNCMRWYKNRPSS